MSRLNVEEIIQLIDNIFNNYLERSITFREYLEKT